MRKANLVIALSLLLACSSCQKEGIGLFKGDYSFKTSGTVTLTELVTDTLAPDSYKISLANEVGQLEISTLDKAADSVLVIMNTMGGSVLVTSAYCDGHNIVFKDFKRNALLLSLQSDITLNCDVNVHATGKMYDDNIVIDMIYDGRAETDSLNYSVYGDDIRLVATRNK